MTKDRIIALLKIERACVETASMGLCERKCGECMLCQDDRELMEMYTEAIEFMEEHDERDNY